MKIELCAFADEAANGLDDQIAALKRNNIHKIELRSIDGKNVKCLSIEDAKDAAAALSAAGIAVHAIGSMLGKSQIAADFDEEEKHLRHLLSLCEIFSCKRIRMFSFYGTTDADADEVVRRLRILADMAEQAGVVLCHENEKEIFGDTAARVEYLLAQVPKLAGVYDPANFLQVGESAQKTLALAPRCAYCHIKDVVAATGELVPAGEGDGDIAGLIRSLHKDTVLTLEPHLAIFAGYAEVDGSRMKNKYTFATNGEAFDAAAAALKNVLRQTGYREEGKVWING